ncbi:MAG: ATP-binding cassette domain-containing protein [Duganella sp.]
MTAALEISNLQTWYGESHILHNVNLTVQPGEVVTLLGRIGAGRTTTLRAIMGLTGARKGSIKINGVEAIGFPTHKIAHLGVGYCPEERGIFASLSTEENLLLLDEISEGLAPVIVQGLARMITTLKSKGYTIVMVEQNFRFAAPLADRFYVMEHGQIVETFVSSELSDKMPVLTELLGV